LLVVHNTLIFLAWTRTADHARSLRFICGATYVT
jgi:hypothetical protein